MTLEDATQTLERGQVLHGEDAQFGQGHVLGWDRVPLAHNKPVTPVPVGDRAWVVAHFVKVERRDQFHNGKRATKVVGLVRPPSS